MKFKKGNIWLVILIITAALLIGVAGYFWQLNNSAASDVAGRCTPTFAVQTGSPELTADQEYSRYCYEAKTKGQCQKVDVYRIITQTFGDSDGIPDCKWTNIASPKTDVPTTDSESDLIRKIDLGSLASAVEFYKIDNGSYPKTSGDPSVVLQSLIPRYLAQIPKDRGGRLYYYEFNPTSGRYFFCASMGGSQYKNSSLTACQNKNCAGTCNYEFTPEK